MEDVHLVHLHEVQGLDDGGLGQEVPGGVDHEAAEGKARLVGHEGGVDPVLVGGKDDVKLALNSVGLFFLPTPILVAIGPMCTSWLKLSIPLRRPHTVWARTKLAVGRATSTERTSLKKNPGKLKSENIFCGSHMMLK